MRRKVEFKAYLKNLRDDEGFINRKLRYCGYAESKVGKDMEEISSSPTEVDAAMCILEGYYSKNAFDKIRAAINTYLDFSKSAWITMSPSSAVSGVFKTYADISNLVTYENSVTSYDKKKTHGLCAFLEAEYDKIRVFAQDVLQNIWQHFPAIPVYLSKERPEEIFQHDRSLLIKKIRKICKECDKKYCVPDCPAFNRMFEEMYFTQAIEGRYYGGVEPHIVLYFKNFSEPWDIHNSKFTTAISEALAHEYLHFLHDYYVDTIVKTTVEPFKDKRLSEALADFFGVLYALEQRYTVTAEYRYDLWRSFEGTGWPYSYALKFFEHPYKVNLTKYSATEINNATQKFRDVFKNTTDPKCAKKLLDI